MLRWHAAGTKAALGSPRQLVSRRSRLASGGGEVLTATIPAKFRARARRDAAAFYLAELARGILAGEVTVAAGEQRTTLATSEFLVLEIEVKQKQRATHVEITLQWPKRPLIRVAVPRGNDHGG
jgi:amphi-Trp domain-containing protein